MDPFAGTHGCLIAFFVVCVLMPYPRSGYGDSVELKTAKSTKKKKSTPPEADGNDVPMEDKPGSGNATPEKKARKKSKKASSG